MKSHLFFFFLMAITIGESAFGQKSSSFPEYLQQVADEHPHYYLIAAENLLKRDKIEVAEEYIDMAKNNNLTAMEIQSFLYGIEPLDGDTIIAKPAIAEYLPSLIEFVINKHIAEYEAGVLENNGAVIEELFSLRDLAEGYAPDLVGTIDNRFCEYISPTEIEIVNPDDYPEDYPNYHADERVVDDAGPVINYVEKRPSFPEGDEAMFAFIKKYLTYPEEAIEDGAEGKVIVSFIVETDGTLSDLKVERGKHPSLNQEAIRLVRIMPKWIPGETMDKKVRTKYLLPVSFKLPTDSN